MKGWRVDIVGRQVVSSVTVYTNFILCKILNKEPSLSIKSSQVIISTDHRWLTGRIYICKGGGVFPDDLSRLLVYMDLNGEVIHQDEFGCDFRGHFRLSEWQSTVRNI